MRQVLRPFGAIGAFINPSAVPGCTKPFNWLSRSLNHSGSWTSELSISTASRVKWTSRLTKLLGSQLACSQPFASNWPQGASLRWNCQPYPLVLWVLELWKSFKPLGQRNSLYRYYGWRKIRDTQDLFRIFVGPCACFGAWGQVGHLANIPGLSFQALWFWKIIQSSSWTKSGMWTS